jgi:hypothetical protein
MLVEFGSKAIADMLNTKSLSDVTSQLNVQQGLSKAEENMIRKTFLKNHLALAGIDYSSLSLERHDGELVDLSEIPTSIASLCPKLREQLKLDDGKDDGEVRVDATDGKKGKKKKRKHKRSQTESHEELSLSSRDLEQVTDSELCSGVKCAECPRACSEAPSEIQLERGSRFSAVVDKVLLEGAYLTSDAKMDFKGFLPIHNIDFKQVNKIDVGDLLNVEIAGFLGSQVILKLDSGVRHSNNNGSPMQEILLGNSLRLEKCESELRKSEARNEILLQRLSDVQTQNMEFLLQVQEHEKQLEDLKRKVFVRQFE